MSMHARSDVSAVTISPAIGGCGELHSRPVHQGAPIKLWTLECEPCESQLINDSHWSRTISGIPETPDEKAYREDQETKGRLDQQNQTAEALAKLGSLGDLPAAIAQLATMFSNPDHRRQDGQACTSCGSRGVMGSKFCGECGKPTAETQAELDELVRVGAHIDVEALSYQQLKDLAAEKGVQSPHVMKKAELIRILSGTK